MSFADPQSVTIGSAISLPRTSSGANVGAFTSADGSTRLSVSHAYGKRIRRTARVDYKKLVTDPLISTNSISVSMSAYVVFDVPLLGLSASDQLAVATGLTGWLSASSNAATTKLLGGEN